MSGFSFVADTNFLIDVHEGKEKSNHFWMDQLLFPSLPKLNYSAGIS